MEDAHLARPGVSADSTGGDLISLFGVFDGHGGNYFRFKRLSIAFRHFWYVNNT